MKHDGSPLPEPISGGADGRTVHRITDFRTLVTGRPGLGSITFPRATWAASCQPPASLVEAHRIRLPTAASATLGMPWPGHTVLHSTHMYVHTSWPRYFSLTSNCPGDWPLTIVPAAHLGNIRPRED